MASVVINGDTSGSVTLQAPAAAGATVLTLPSTSGTIVITSGAQTIEFADGSASAPSITNSGDTNTGIFFPAADTIAFAEGGVEAMRLDSSGNVGIGTTSPSYKLDIRNSGGSNGIHLSNSGTNDTGAYINASGDSEVMLSGGANYNSYSAPNFVMTAKSTVASGVYCTGDTIRFWVNTGLTAGTTFNQTERMRIDSSGKVGIGMSPTDPLTIQCSSQTFGGGLGFKLSGGANNWGVVVGGDAKLYLGYSATTTPSAVGNFATNGTYTATSDIRKKKDISYTFNGLEIVNALKPAQGRMLEDDNTSPLRPMFIAQDMVDVIPALVSNLEPEPSDDPLLGVDYASITPILVKAIQEQQTIINDLKARIETLENK